MISLGAHFPHTRCVPVVSNSSCMIKIHLNSSEFVIKNFFLVTPNEGQMATLEFVVSSWLFVHINSWCSWFFMQILGTTQKKKDKSSQAAVVCARASATIRTPAGSSALLCSCPPFFATPGLHVTAARGAGVHINTH